jgi:hypothetical protein
MRYLLEFLVYYTMAVFVLYLIEENTYPKIEPPAYHPHECVRFTHGIWLPCRETLYPLKSGQPV